IGDTGIQYGLLGLQKGLISAQQFVDLNTHVGGLDYNGEKTAARVPPDLVGLQRAYSTGAVNSANHLDEVAIIDLRGPDPGAFHEPGRLCRRVHRRAVATAPSDVPRWRMRLHPSGSGPAGRRHLVDLPGRRWRRRVRRSSTRPGTDLSAVALTAVRIGRGAVL